MSENKTPNPENPSTNGQPLPGQEKKEPTSTDQVLELFSKSYSQELEEKLKKLLVEKLQKDLTTLSQTYFLLFLWTTESLSRGHLDAIYHSLREGNCNAEGAPQKPVLLFIKNKGGSIEPAYKISKICNQLSKDKFVVAVPREAKSAATLVSMGAEEIHLGALSELGPIDPQINGLPALGLQDSLKTIAGIVTEFPNSSKLFSEYLGRTLHIHVFGWTARVVESAIQYGQRLLTMHRSSDKFSSDVAKAISNRLVKEYNDHGFVIDAEEAKDVFKNKLIKIGTPESAASEQIYDFISLFSALLEVVFNKNFSLVGALSEKRVNFPTIENDKK